MAELKTKVTAESVDAYLDAYLDSVEFIRDHYPD